MRGASVGISNACYQSESNICNLYQEKGYLLNSIVLTSIIYITFFNYLPSGFRLAMAGCVGLLIVMALFAERPLATSTVLAGRVTIIIMIGTAAIAYIADIAPPTNSFVEYAGRTIRMLTGLAAVAFFVSEAKLIRPWLILALYLGV